MTTVGQSVQGERGSEKALPAGKVVRTGLRVEDPMGCSRTSKKKAWC